MKTPKIDTGKQPRSPERWPRTLRVSEATHRALKILAAMRGVEMSELADNELARLCKQAEIRD